MYSEFTDDNIRFDSFWVPKYCINITNRPKTIYFPMALNKVHNYDTMSSPTNYGNNRQKYNLKKKQPKYIELFTSTWKWYSLNDYKYYNERWETHESGRVIDRLNLNRNEIYVMLYFSHCLNVTSFSFFFFNAIGLPNF